IDLYVDGADSLFSEQKVCIKGRGGAMLREKVLAYAAKEFILLIEDFKFEKKVKIPIEVLPFSLNFVYEELKKFNLNPIIRTSDGKLGPVVSDNNNFIVDILPEDFYYDNLEELNNKLMNIPGIVGTGIFKRDLKVVSNFDEEIKMFDV
ncbi:MAG: ribose-5-phosphate isomerase A, partial [Candidatus Micrarchaeota archaeon]|nr:ribose-5-phosphate isomerase A [Candidatus Micrarchaeota archaeon]